MTNKKQSFLDSDNPAYIRRRILKDLETTFLGAVDGGKYLAAIRAKELQGRELGLFADKKVKQSDKSEDGETLHEMSDGALKKLLGENLPESETDVERDSSGMTE